MIGPAYRRANHAAETRSGRAAAEDLDLIAPLSLRAEQGVIGLIDQQIHRRRAVGPERKPDGDGDRQ